MSIQEHLNKIRNAIYGREVRESIAKGIETAYDDASEKDNANMEVKIARGTHPNLRSRLEEVDSKQQETTAQLAQTDSKKVDKDGSQQVKWANIAQDAREQISGDKVAVVGKDSVGTENLTEGAVTEEKTAFIQKSTNLVDELNVTKGHLIDISGSLVENEQYRVTDYIKVEPNETYTFKNIVSVALYDSDMIFVNREFVNEDNNNPLVLPQDIQYVRLNIDYKNPQMNKGDVLLPYEEPYAPTLKGVNSSPFGGIALVSIYPGGELPNYDTEENTLEFPSDFFIYYGDTRFDMESTTIKVESSSDSPGLSSGFVVFFDTKTKTFISRDFRDIGRIPSTAIMFCVIVSERTVPTRLIISCPYTVNGESTVEKNIGNNDKFEKSSNLFTLENLTKRHLINPDGLLAERDSYRVTDYIKVEPGETYTFKNIVSVALYDVNKNFLNRPAVDSNEEYKEFTMPDDVHYVRLNYNVFRWAKQMNVGNVLLPYEKPDTFYLKDTELSKERFYFPPGDLVGHYEPSESYTYDEFDENETTAQQYNDKFSLLAEENPEYITETLLGNDQSGTYPIYKYTFKAKEVPFGHNVNGKDIPKIIIACGVHGSEKASRFSLYYFLKELCENWQSNSILEYLRFNVEFVVIPNANPWGFDNGTRANSREVDLNRNFPLFWTQYEESGWGTTLFGGEEPFSEVETQYIRDTILENKDALHFCDFHTNNGSGENQNQLFFVNIANDDLKDDDIVVSGNEWVSKATREFIKRYDQPDDVGYFGYVQAFDGATSMAYAQSQGIASSTTESFLKFPNQSTRSNPIAIKAGTELIGNWFATVLKQFKNKA